jgi:Spy/CpxP family protein refolding chaperone
MHRFTRGIFAATACLTLGAATLAAQETTPAPAPAQNQVLKQDRAQHMRHMRGHKMARMHGMKHMGQELNLTDAQKTQLKGIHEQQRTKMQELHNNQSLTKEQKMEQMKALRQSNHEQMLSVLTPEQKTRMEQMKADRKAKMEKRRAERKEFREWKKQKEGTEQKPQ